MSSDTACFTGDNANYVKNIFVNESGQMVQKSSTTVRNGVRVMRTKDEYFKLITKEEEIISNLNTLCNEYSWLSTSLRNSKSITLKEAPSTKNLKKIHTALQNEKYDRAEAIAKRLINDRWNLYSPETNILIRNYVREGNGSCEKLYSKYPEKFSELMDGFSKDIKQMPEIKKLSFQERKQIRSRMGVLAKQRKKLETELKEIRNQIARKDYMQRYNDDGLPIGFGHLDRGHLDLNF